MSAACRLHQLLVTTRLLFSHQFFNACEQQMIWSPGKEIGAGAEGGTLPPLIHRRVHTPSLTLFPFLSAQHDFRQMGDQFVPCCFVCIKSTLPFLDQCKEQRHFPQVMVSHYQLGKVSDLVTCFTFSLVCTATTATIAPGAPAGPAKSPSEWRGLVCLGRGI